VVVSSLRLVNFRSYCDATVLFGQGLNVVVGENATGKTNLLEAAWFALRGSSPRTRRDDKLITWGERFARVELELDGTGTGTQRVDVGFAAGQGKRVRWEGLRRGGAHIWTPSPPRSTRGTPPRHATFRACCGSATHSWRP
jgi:recombinational DNA repair ATPase RecF